MDKPKKNKKNKNESKKVNVMDGVNPLFGKVSVYGEA